LQISPLVSFLWLLAPWSWVSSRTGGCSPPSGSRSGCQDVATMWGTPIGVAAGSTPGWQPAALAGCSPGPSRHPLGRLLVAPRSSCSPSSPLWRLPGASAPASPLPGKPCLNSTDSYLISGLTGHLLQEAPPSGARCFWLLRGTLPCSELKDHSQLTFAGQGVGPVWLGASPCCTLGLSFHACKAGVGPTPRLLSDDPPMIPQGLWQGSHSFHGI
jgi:hypothetical protein